MHTVPRSSPEVREAFCRAARDFSLEALSAGPVATMAREALRSSGKLAQRQSPLQPLFVLWFLLGRSLFPADSLAALFRRLSHALRGRIPGLDGRTVTDGALCHAKARLGVAPVVALLRSLADVPAPRFHGLRVLALDGVRLDVPDTPDNVRAFGRRVGRYGPSFWPQVVLVLLLDVATRIPRDARLAPCDTSEKMVARDLLSSAGTEDLLLLDGGYYGVPFFRAVADRGASFLCPVPRHVLFRRRGPARAEGAFLDYVASLRSHRMLASGRTRVVRMDVRVIEVRLRGFRHRRFVTNLPPSVPSRDVVEAYRRRWEVETAFDEIKTVLCHPPAGATPTELRSKTSGGVCQEAFALLCAYSLVRRTMAEAAEREGSDPLALGFTDALRTITQAATAMLGTHASRLPALHAEMLRDIATLTLRRPKPPRSCPRRVKRKAQKYARRDPPRGVAA